LAIFIAIFKAMTHTVNVAVLKNGLSEFLAKVQSGDSILVCSRNKPVAKITPLPSRPNRSTQGFDPAVKIFADLEGPVIPPEDWGILAGVADAR
jgi:prevent-host-death family protein